MAGLVPTSNTKSGLDISLQLFRLGVQRKALHGVIPTPLQDEATVPLPPISAIISTDASGSQPGAGMRQDQRESHKELMHESRNHSA